jgi:hypothetical protein
MMSREERVEYWRVLVQKQSVSGMNGAAFCKQERINPQRFYFWRRRFSCDSSSPEFVRLVPTSKTPCSGIRILLDQRIYVEVDRGFDPLTLKEAIDALCTMGG